MSFAEVTANYLAPFSRFVTCPNILAEANNLLRLDRLGRTAEVFSAFRDFAKGTAEIYQQSIDTSHDALFEPFGVPDTVIVKFAERDIAVFTVDRDLFGLLASRGVRVVNLRYYRVSG